MKYFSVQELCESGTARTRKIVNVPDKEQLSCLVKLVENVLDPLREAYGKPIHVSSGFRCAELNKAVGGAANSHHLKGMAADIHTDSWEGNKQLFRLAQRLKLPFCQLIWEKPECKWVHISYNENDLRRQVLRIV